MIVMEYAKDGDLLNYLKSNGTLEETEAKSVFRQVVVAVGHIHARSIIHRDVKLDNILMSGGSVKICDFGVSKILRDAGPIREQCGTPAYIAPEIIANKGYLPYLVDIWSLGILLYALLQGRVPYKGEDLDSLLKVIMTEPLEFKY